VAGEVVDLLDGDADIAEYIDEKVDRTSMSGVFNLRDIFELVDDGFDNGAAENSTDSAASAPFLWPDPSRYTEHRAASTPHNTNSTTRNHPATRSGCLGRSTHDYTPPSF